MSFTRFVVLEWCFLSMGGDRGMSTVNCECVGVTVVWCVGVLSAYVWLETMGLGVQVEVLGCVNVMFCVCWGERESVWVCFVGV